MKVCQGCVESVGCGKPLGSFGSISTRQFLFYRYCSDICKPLIGFQHQKLLMCFLNNHSQRLGCTAALHNEPVLPLRALGPFGRHVVFGGGGEDTIVARGFTEAETTTCVAVRAIEVTLRSPVGGGRGGGGGVCRGGAGELHM